MEDNRQHTFEFRARVVMEALREERTIEEIAEYFAIQPEQVKTWKLQAVDALSAVLHGLLVLSRGAEEPRGDHARMEWRDLHAFVSG